MSVFRAVSSTRKLFDSLRLLSARHYSQTATSVPSSSVQDDTVDLIYTSEHLQLRESLGKIIDRDINPYVDEWEKAGEFPAHQVFKTLGSAGFLGVSKPTEYGGLGLDYSYSVAVSEELGRINCGAIPMAIGVQTDMSTPALATFGSSKVKKEFLEPSIAGDMVSCLGVSEAGAGSDVASIKTTAVKKGGDYVINGGKMWTTNGNQADWMCLLANTSEGPVHQNKSIICLPMNLNGITKTKINKMGMWSSDTMQVFFEDVRVPQDFIVGEEGMGFTYQMVQFQVERMFAAAAALVPLQKLVQTTADYARERELFGQPLLNNQTVHFTLAELETEIEMLRSCLYRAVVLYNQGNDATKLASMCKLKAGRLAREVSDKCLQFWGGMGFTSDVLVSRFYRDFRLLSIGGGADEVMLSIICKFMNTLPKPPKPQKKLK